ncbi:maleylpyruvate isomerase [Paraburkholderia sp. BL23I1N1]|uniref:maleylacetoacetate isomerase n=1 Tax=Paraburkholderia sp. BL23I1N1 TaxID=1938802 RepID=UPI000E76FE37|nr:maleylacetoacetate isomerase [Paraburkholderia sp. BL23I1N1]RKE39025.1 maleylpyruvate isomerase [Paraburkholderia sp. BL23I1N1]
MKLYSYFRSSSAYRVRIACNLKNLPYEYVAIHLNRNGGEQYSDSFLKVNAQQTVPVLQDETVVLSQSLAIIEYLDERFPARLLLPDSVEGRARVRSLSHYIACEIHPLNNLRVLKFLTGPLGLSEERKLSWIRHWLETGLTALERELATERGGFCYGDTPTMADCCLVPQLYNARRFGVDVARFPVLQAIDERCHWNEAFQTAHPNRQPDSE